MRRLPYPVVVFALLAAGAFCGHALRRNSAPTFMDTTAVTSAEAMVPARAVDESPTQRGRDAVSQIRKIASTGNASTRSRLIAEIGDHLDARQIRDALAELEITHLPERRKLAVELVRRWGKLDPKAALDFAKAIPVDYARDELLRAAINGWAQTDLAAAREWALATTGPLKESALRGLVGAMAASDPKGACALVVKIGQRFDEGFAEELFDQWTEKDPRQAAQYASQLPKGFLRDQSINVVAQRWATKDISSALAWAESMWDAQISRIEQRTYPSWADGLTDVLSTWLREDRQSTLAWIAGISDPQKREKVLGTLVAVEGDRDPAQASRLIFEITEPGEAQDTLIKDVAFRWSSVDPGGSLQWIEDLPDDRLKQMVLPRAVLHLSPFNAQSAIELAEKIGGNAKEATVRGALGNWTRGNPAAAAAWVEAQPPNQFYYANVARTWAGQDATAATEWVNHLPPGKTRDQSIHLAVTDMDPALGAQWVQAISDPAIREQASVQLAKSWLQQDTEAARAWIEIAPLNQKSKDELLKPARK